MQTLQFTRALRAIVKELKVAELVEFLQPFITQGNTIQITEAQKNRFSELLFASHSGYERLIEDPINKNVISSLKTDEIYQPARMGKLLSTLSAGGQAQNIWGNPANFVEFFSFVDLLRSLASLEKTCTELLEKEKLGEISKPEEILEIQLIDYDNTGIEPERLATLVSTLTQLHTDLARIMSISDNRPVFIYFDSGSDFITGLRCAGNIAEKLKTLLAEFWDRIVYRKYDEFGKQMDAVSTGLSVIGEIKEAVANGTLTEEEGGLLRTRVLRGVDTLTAIGASLPLGESVTKVDQRKLLIERRDMKLLGTGEVEQTDSSQPQPPKE
jgi:hypothetical protein